MSSYGDFKRQSYSDRDGMNPNYGYGAGGGEVRGGGPPRPGQGERVERMDDPPHSRLFIIGGKTLTEEDFREAFSPFGTIESISVKTQKGISYVKFSKTSEAAEALEEMNGKSIGVDPRPLKIVIASSKSSGNQREDVNPLRLFMVIPKSYTDEKLKEVFDEWGPVEYVSIVKNRQTNESRGFGYVKYFRFSHAAKALECCDVSFKPKFADPRPPKEGDSPYSHVSKPVGYGGGGGEDYGMRPRGPGAGGPPAFDTNMSNPSGVCKLTIMANPILSQEKLWKLFDVIPGLEFCELNQQADMSGERAYGTVMYNNPKSAAYAIEKLHGFDYPLGSRVMIKFDESPVVPQGYGGAARAGPGYGGGGAAGGGGGGGGTNPNMPSDIKNLVSTIQHATQMLQASGYAAPAGSGPTGASWGVTESPLDPSMCSANLPPAQPLAPTGTGCVTRLFFVCKDCRENPPPHIVTDVFSRFGNLIEAYLMKNKNCGYAKYSDDSSAQRAIRTLNEQTLMGCFMKVMVAEDSSAAPKRPRSDFD